LIILAIVAVAATSLVVSVPARADDTTTPSDAPGMRVYRDPTTGEITGPPSSTGRAVAPEIPEAQPPPLVLEPNPAGGLKARLGEAYNHSMRATTDASGKTTVGCEHGAAAPKE
jgi:hypothetical protein